MRLEAFTAALMGVVLIGCAASLSAASSNDACALLQQARVSAALGVSVGAGEHIAGPSGCEWAGQGKRATLTITQPLDNQSPVDRFNLGKTPVSGVTKEPASGVGDDAYYVYLTKAPGSGTGLVVKQGTFVFEIRVYGFPLEQAKTITKTLAQNVIDNL